MGKYDDKNPQKGGKWLGLILVLLFTQPMLVIPLVVFGSIIWLIIKIVTRQQQVAGKTSSRPVSRQEKFDDCPQPLFCFHKDKGEHHVRKGKEIDPWDRPDIDISKYQRNR